MSCATGDLSPWNYILFIVVKFCNVTFNHVMLSPPTWISIYLLFFSSNMSHSGVASSIFWPCMPALLCWCSCGLFLWESMWLSQASTDVFRQLSFHAEKDCEERLLRLCANSNGFSAQVGRCVFGQWLTALTQDWFLNSISKHNMYFYGS